MVEEPEFPTGGEAPQPGALSVTVLTGPMAGHRFPLDKPTVTLGRNQANEVCLPLDPRISRWHAVVNLTDRGPVLSDRNSGNGTWVEEVRIYDPVLLRSGTQFRVGRTWLRFDEESAESAGPRDAQQRVVVVDAEAPERGEAAAQNIVFTMKAAGRPPELDAAALQQRLQAYRQVGDAIGQSLELQTTLEAVVDSIMEVLGAERGFLMLADRETGELEARVVRPRGGATSPESITISRHIVERARREKVAVLIADVATDSRLRDADSVVGLEIRSAACAPLLHRDQDLGIIYLDTTAKGAIFDESDLALLTSVANQAAMAIQNARLYSDLRQAYEELQATQDHLLQTERLTTVGALSASIAHDIGNVVTPLAPLVRMLSAQSEGDEELREAVNRQLTRLSALIERLRSFSRPPSLSKQPTDVSEVVRSSMTLISTEANHRGVEVVLHLAEDLPPVLADATQLDRVFLNLALNAIQAAEEHRGRVDITTELDLPEVAVRFRDNGRGVPPEHLPHLFEPLFTTKEQGMGLGLYSSKRIVEEEHGGSIEVDSRPDEGTEITVRLPVPNAEHTPVAAEPDD